MKTANGLSENSSPRQAPPPLLELPEGLCCPGCRGTLSWHDTRARCGRCGKTLVILGGRIPDFLAGENPSVDAILGWSDGFVRNAEPWLLALASGRSVSGDASAELEAQELVEKGHLIRGERASTKRWRCDPGSRLTALGSNLAYHCAEFSFQSTRGSPEASWERFTRLSALGAEATVLDVGCGAGQTLRLLHPYHPAERVGLDIDPEALAFGCRLAQSNGEAIHFVRASAYRIPFRDNRFTHVICRVALNYVHQRRALCEMVRVLQPRGYLYCSVEGPGFDLHFLRQSQTAAQLMSRLRDLFYGLTLSVTGAQPAPGSRLTGGRVWGTFRGCTQALCRAGCEVIHAKTTSRYLSLPMAFDVVARKR
jgi:SAM-dependent methyltransferase